MIITTGLLLVLQTQANSQYEEYHQKMRDRAESINNPHREKRGGISGYLNRKHQPRQQEDDYYLDDQEYYDY